MSTWSALVSTALLGTERNRPAMSNEGSVACMLVRQTDTADAETTVLHQAAILTLARLAGFAPAEAELAEEIVQAEVEVSQRCGRRGTGILAKLLAEQKTDLVMEWLQAAQRAGRHAAPEVLPDLLDYGAKHAALRPAIAAAAGRRGVWLAKQNPDWHFARTDASEAASFTDAEITAKWETGTSSERRVLLAGLRTRDSVRGLSLLESTWQTDSVNDRANFLPVLRNGLTFADEPFLEQALNDKRKEVRRTAADLLALIDLSAHCRRMTARVAPLLSLRRSLLGGEIIEVQLPTEWDASMGRDGIEAKPPKDSGYGERAWLIRQMLGFISPSWWVRSFHREPPQLLKAASKSAEWGDLLVAAWTEAANRFGLLAWKEALVSHAVDRPKSASKYPKEPILPALTGMPEERLESLLVHLFSTGQDAHGEMALPMLQERRSPWSSSLARIVVKGAFKTLKAQTGYTSAGFQAKSLLDLAALYSPPLLAEEFDAAWGSTGSKSTFASSTVDEFLKQILFRQDIRTAILEEG